MVSVARKQTLPKKPLLTHPDHLQKFYGANLAEVFRTPLYDCSLKNDRGQTGRSFSVASDFETLDTVCSFLKLGGLWRGVCLLCEEAA